MSYPRTASSIKSNADIIEFASLAFRGQRFEVLQAYYSNLFDLWESESDLSTEAGEYLCRQRWAVDDYCTDKGWYLDRDFPVPLSDRYWLAVHDGKRLTGALFSS